MARKGTSPSVAMSSFSLLWTPQAFAAHYVHISPPCLSISDIACDLLNKCAVCEAFARLLGITCAAFPCD